MNDLWQHLKQRKLVQWAVAYVAFAFALLQGVDIVAQRFAWPESITRGLIIVSCIGFFVTLLLAWYHGERGAQKVSGTELLILALVLVLGGGFLWKFAPGPSAAPVPRQASSAEASPTDTIDAKSIAVLPFTNMSADKDDAYFADGLSDEIINSLSRVPDLQVAARTSSFALRDSKDTVPEIARKLRVATVLEGSVRRAGDHIRMTAQLIRAKDGFELWSETYDRSSDDIIVIQEQVARAIALALKTATDPKALADMQRVGTRVVPAYNAYLKGLALRIQGTASGDYRLDDQAMQSFDQAIALDPGFSDAYAQAVSLARDYADPVGQKSLESAAVPYTQRMRDLKRRLDLASEHARDPAQASLYRSLRAWADLRFADALRLIQVYLVTRPENFEALGQASRLSNIVGDKDLSREYAERSYALSENTRALGDAMGEMRRVPDPARAVVMARETLKRFPDNASIAYQAQRIFLTAGLIDEAAALLPVMLSSDLSGDSKALVQMRQACAEGRRRDAEALFQAVIRGTSDTNIEWHGLLLLGRDDEAAKLLAIYDHPQTLFTMSNYLVYPKLDVQRYPVLLANLQAQGIKPPAFRPEPYNCKPEATSS